MKKKELGITVLYFVLWVLTPLALWPLVQHSQNHGYSLVNAIMHASWLTDSCKSIFLSGVIIMTYTHRGSISDHWSKWKQRKTIQWAVIGLGAILVYQLLYALVLPMNDGGNGTTEYATQFLSNTWWMLNLVIAGPVVEELFFRKVLFGSNIFGYRWIWRAIGSSLLFALFHADWMYYFLYFGMGLLLVMVYSKTRTITAPIAVHIMLNALVLAIQVIG